jgi:hypothetical protein
MKYHTDERSCSCPHCDMAFHEHKTLRSHIASVHKDEDVPSDTVEQGRELFLVNTNLCWPGLLIMLMSMQSALARPIWIKPGCRRNCQSHPAHQC